MAIKGLDKYSAQNFARFAEGNFEYMLRMCHNFGNGPIIIKKIDGIFTAVDADQNNVIINYWYGDPDCLYDTVYVYDGEICRFVKRLDNGDYKEKISEVPQAYKIRFDSVLAKVNNKGVTRRIKQLFHR